MKRLLLFIILFSALNLQAQIKTKFGGTRATDTAHAALSLRVDSVVRLLKYATSDATKFIQVNSQGFLVNATPAGAGDVTQSQLNDTAAAIRSDITGGSTDSAVYSTKAYRQKAVDSLNINIALRKLISDSTASTGYATRGWRQKLADSIGVVLAGVVTSAVGGADITVAGTTTPTITTTYSTGKAGGQTVIGGTGASENITLSSTSNGTKGSIYLGANSYFDETNNGLNVISTSTSSLRGMSIYQHNAGVQAPSSYFYKSRGTHASPSNCSTGDLCGAFSFAPYLGGAYVSDRSLFGAAVTSSTGISQWFITGTTNGNYVPTLLIAENGNVGIGALGGNVVSSLTLPTEKLQVDGNLYLSTAGNKIKIATGTNASAGTSGAMTAGSITISTNAVTASSIIMLTPIGAGAGSISLGTITAGSQFIINSSDGADVRSVQWIIIN